METENDISKRLALAEVQIERSKIIMESLAGFCHALGQPATVLLSSIELLKMKTADPELQTQVLDICYDAVIEIRDLLAQMKEKREYAAEAYLERTESAGTMLSIEEWRNKKPPKASWEKDGSPGDPPAFQSNPQ